MDFFELSVGNMSVNLGGGDRRVTEHCLNRTDIGAISQEIGGIAMTERMGRNSVSRAAWERIAGLGSDASRDPGLDLAPQPLVSA